MAAKPAIIIESCGMLWKIPFFHFRTMMRVMSQGNPVSFNDYGTCIGCIDYNMKDTTKEEAKEILHQLEKQTPRGKKV